MRLDPAGVGVALRQQARATSTGCHMSCLGTVTNNVMVTVRCLVGATTVPSQRGSQSTSSLIRRALPRISGEGLQRLVSVLNDYCYSFSLRHRSSSVSTCRLFTLLLGLGVPPKPGKP